MSLLNNCLSSRHNVHRCWSPNQTLSLFPALERNRLWLQILSNLRGNKINLLFRHSAVCLHSRPGATKKDCPALYMLSFLSLLNSRKHLWNIYFAAGIIVYEWSAQQRGVNDHGCLLGETKALTLVTHSDTQDRIQPRVCVPHCAAIQPTSLTKHWKN